MDLVAYQKTGKYPIILSKQDGYGPIGQINLA